MVFESDSLASSSQTVAATAIAVPILGVVGSYIHSAEKYVHDMFDFSIELKGSVY